MNIMAYSRKYDGYKEFLLNKICNQKQFNYTRNVGETMALIRECQPSSYEEWENWYFENAKTKRKQPTRITRDIMNNYGVQLREVVRNEFIPAILDAIQNLTDEEIESYVYNLAVKRTYDGYITEKKTVSELISKHFPDVLIEESTPEQDHAGNIDFIINVGNYKIGLQIKPITANSNFGAYSLPERLQESFDAFQQEYGGMVFIVFSKDGKIANEDIVNDIKNEIERLKSMSEIK